MTLEEANKWIDQFAREFKKYLRDSPALLKDANEIGMCDEFVSWLEDYEPPS